MFDIGAFLPSGLTALILGTVGYAFKRNESKMDKIEDRLNQRITESSVRQIIDDKIDPVREDLEEIKQKIDKLTDACNKQGVFQVRRKYEKGDE